MADRDGGLADTYWHQYYTPGELEELLDVSSTTMFVSGRYPIHARLALQPHASGTVLMAHGLLLYGAIFGRMILPYHRAGFNVVQFDMPGFGQSGGPRGGCTAREIVQAFKDAFAFARSQLGGAVHFVSAAEDGIFGYYALAGRRLRGAVARFRLGVSRQTDRLRPGPTGAPNLRDQGHVLDPLASGLSRAERSARPQAARTRSTRPTPGSGTFWCVVHRSGATASAIRGVPDAGASCRIGTQRVLAV
jgi:pimeloyl-ACP methyl ester carboxylesterase